MIANKIAASIQEFGWTNPILMRPDGVIIAGHARLAAAKQLGLKEVPAIQLSGLNEAQCRALALADNQLALNAAWDEDLLRAELAALKQQDFDLNLIGFSAEELARLLAEQEDRIEKTPDPDAVPAVPKTAVTEPGDLWLLGKHRLVCGDALCNETIELALGGDPAHMVFTELPEHLFEEGEPARKGRPDMGEREQQFRDFLRAGCANLVTSSQGAIYISLGSSRFPALHQAFHEAGGHWSTDLIWVQQRLTPGRSEYASQHVPVLYGWREGGDRYWSGARDQGDVWNSIPLSTATEQQPVDLVERAVENSSRPGDTVLDPFAGTGTTLIACERMGRKACLVELDPRCVDVICKRWEAFSGQPAIRNRDGRTYIQLAHNQETTL